MAMAVTSYGQSVTEHRAAGHDLPVFSWPCCPRCASSTWSKGLVLRKRIGAWVRLVRCKVPQCRAVIVLQPPWAPIRLGATMAEVEHVLATHEQAGTWREAATAAGLEHNPRKYRRWRATFALVMLALLPSLPGLRLQPDGDGWLAQVRALLGVADHGVLEVLRWHLFNQDRVVLGPTRLLALGRPRARAPPTP